MFLHWERRVPNPMTNANPVRSKNTGKVLLNCDYFKKDYNPALQESTSISIRKLNTDLCKLSIVMSG